MGKIRTDYEQRTWKIHTSLPQEVHFLAEIPQENWASLVEGYQTQI